LWSGYAFRHPTLKSRLEAGIGWVAAFIDRLDHIVDRGLRPALRGAAERRVPPQLLVLLDRRPVHDLDRTIGTTTSASKPTTARRRHVAGLPGDARGAAR
jgi:hypothetical protein